MTPDCFAEIASTHVESEHCLNEQITSTVQPDRDVCGTNREVVCFWGRNVCDSIKLPHDDIHAFFESVSKALHLDLEPVDFISETTK
jgi:hypothetical protein